MFEEKNIKFKINLDIKLFQGIINIPSPDLLFVKLKKKNSRFHHFLLISYLLFSRLKEAKQRDH